MKRLYFLILFFLMAGGSAFAKEASKAEVTFDWSKWATVFIAIIGPVLTFWGVNRQIKANVNAISRQKWIEYFRNLLGEYLSIVNMLMIRSLSEIEKTKKDFRDYEDKIGIDEEIYEGYQNKLMLQKSKGITSIRQSENYLKKEENLFKISLLLKDNIEHRYFHTKLLEVNEYFESNIYSDDGLQAYDKINKLLTELRILANEIIEKEEDNKRKLR